MLARLAQGVQAQVEARFRTKPGPSTAFVRAVEAKQGVDPWRPIYLPNPQLIWPGNYWFQSWVEYHIYLLYTAYYQRWQATFEKRTSALGAPPLRRVTFGKDGTSAPVRFPLDATRLVKNGVGAFGVEWKWQYRFSEETKWTDMAVSRHRVFAILDLPTLPWQNQPVAAHNTQLPWVEVLEVACAWAEGAQTRREAASKVTEVVFGLGEGVIAYGCPIGALTMYASPFGAATFNCSAFLERVAGGVGNGPYVNCTDCATIVSTFANILGCDLWQSRMGTYNPAFETNPIQAIGSHKFESPCGWGLGFTYHEVAWNGDCGVEDQVYDACLRVRTDPLAPTPGSTGVLPQHMRFGKSGDGDYRDKIAAPNSRAVCVPDPTERKRRAVY